LKYERFLQVARQIPFSNFTICHNERDTKEGVVRIFEQHQLPERFQNDWRWCWVGAITVVTRANSEQKVIEALRKVFVHNPEALDIALIKIDKSIATLYFALEDFEWVYTTGEILKTEFSDSDYTSAHLGEEVISGILSDV
jgi:hypothetical protein